MEINLHVAFICKKEVTIQETLMYSYTFCDLFSGNNFTMFSLTPVKQYESFKQLQVADIKCLLNISKSGTLKLKPVKEA